MKYLNSFVYKILIYKSLQCFEWKMDLFSEYIKIRLMNESAKGK